MAPEAYPIYNSVLWLLGCVAVIAFVYILVRTASFAYFRTRLEHLKSIMKLRKDHHG